MNPPPPSPSAASPIPPHHPNPPPPSLPTVLSDLSSLLDLSTSTLGSLPIPTSTTSAALLQCPFNPNHLLPPASFFSHYLNCPSPLSLPHNFHYPLTLHSAATTTIAGITTPIPASSFSDLSISLGSYMGFKAPDNNFFYQNCPGPVTPSSEPPPLLNLPRDLYIECADFNKGTPLDNVVEFSVDFIKFLPSEIWAIRSEIEAWGGGFAAAYSSRILRAILRLRDCKLLHLSDWIVSNSPRYGGVLDFAMGDHMVLLIRLCLKLVVKEAFGLVGVMSKDGELKVEENVLPALSNRSFECPVLVKVMSWLSLQFSILYGNVNGKFFVVEVLKECILDAAFSASLFQSESKDAQQSEFEKVHDVQEPVARIEIDDIKRDERKDVKSETVGDSVIFLSQVAAAVSALHERSFIEGKIKARNSQPLPAYQRNMDHEYVSKIANKERQRRLEYRPIIEHDGFLWQRSNNQDTNKVKTREELLAEERDYKRRRMSYRGKKVKRNPLEVMRDIINEYTEEIKQAGGGDDRSKAREETEASVSDELNAQASATGVAGSRRNPKIPELNRDKSLDYTRELSSHHFSEDLEGDFMQSRQDLNWDRVDRDLNTKLKRNRYGVDDYSRSQDGRQSSSHSREQIHGREKQGYVGAREGSPRRSIQRSKSRERNNHKYRDEHERSYHRREREYRERDHKRESMEDNQKLGERGRRNADGAREVRLKDSEGRGDRKRSKTENNRSSCPEIQEFDDRYNPAESHGLYDDDF